MAAIDSRGQFRVSAKSTVKNCRKAAIRFPIAGDSMSEAARFSNEMIPKLLPGFENGIVVLEDVRDKERWCWNYSRSK